MARQVKPTFRLQFIAQASAGPLMAPHAEEGMRGIPGTKRLIWKDFRHQTIPMIGDTVVCGDEQMEIKDRLLDLDTGLWILTGTDVVWMGNTEEDATHELLQWEPEIRQAGWTVEVEHDDKHSMGDDEA